MKNMKFRSLALLVVCLVTLSGFQRILEPLKHWIANIQKEQPLYPEPRYFFEVLEFFKRTISPTIRSDLRLDQTVEYSYAQKIMLKEGSIICCMGDIHGSVEALIRNLMVLQKMRYLDKNFRMRKNFYLVFTGDNSETRYFVNEKAPLSPTFSSSSTVYTLLLLALHNKGHVFLIRGNHEIFSESLDFQSELKRVYQQRAEPLIHLINDSYFKILPAVVCLGVSSKRHKNTTWIFCTHIGFNPNMKSALQQFLTNPKQTYLTGLKDDFFTCSEVDPGAIGGHILIRGHEHSFYGVKIGTQHWPEMLRKGEKPTLVESGTWQIKMAQASRPIFTLSTASQTPNVKQPYDAFIILNTKQANFKDWGVTIYEKQHQK
jgi:hypothetical protein